MIITPIRYARDAPPTEPVQCFGPEAAAYTQARLQDRPVQLEADIEARDRYGRRLAYVIVDGDRFNDHLLRRGYARLLVIEPNHAHARAMLQEELAPSAQQPQAAIYVLG